MFLTDPRSCCRRHDDDRRDRGGVENVELGDHGNVGRLIRGVEGRREYGRQGSHHGVESGHVEYPGCDHKVNDEETGEDDDPGPDWEEGGHQAQTDGPVAGMQQEERSGTEVR